MAIKRTVPVMAMSDIVALIEKMAEEFMMADIKDLPAIAKLCKSFGTLGAVLLTCPDPALDAGVMKVSSEVALKASALIKGVILTETKAPQEDMDLAGKALAVLQTMVCARKITDIPAELGISGPARTAPAAEVPVADGQKSADVSQAVGKQLPSFVSGMVDDVIFKAFIEQQESVFPDLEGAILGYEKDGNAESLNSFKRMLHTMKGEAGVMGIVAVEKMCHAVEDYILSGKEIQVDLLLEAKDWLERAVSSCKNGTEPENPAKFIEKLISNSGSASAVAEVAAPVAPVAPPVMEQQHVTAINISDAEMARDFVNEAQEHFDSADDNLLTLEHDPNNKDAIATVFRAFHTIKGVSSFLGITPITDLGHVAETLLDEVRKGKRVFGGNVVDVTFAGLDMLKMLVGDLGTAVRSGTPLYVRREYPAVLARVKAVVSGISEPAEAVVVKQAPVAKPVAPVKQSEDVHEEARPAAEGEQRAAAGGVEVRQAMKVDAEKIDLLLDTIGELVIAESIVAQDKEIVALQSQRLDKNISHLTKITRMLQDLGMSMRLVPIDATFRKMARLVRDLSKKVNKEVEFITEGSETEIDKGMVEKLADPLVHMIRNSLDHGIEAEKSTRIAAGKDPIGHITLRAYHKGGSIHIDIQDDGRGLDKEAIIAKGIERGLINSGDGMSDQQVFMMIFGAGFSTAKVVTEVSGRGVGMDVVRRNIETLRGNILIKSEKGVGTTFTIVLPLTMAIIDGILARVGTEMYIIPTMSIVESIKPTSEIISTINEKSEMIMFRNSILPLFRLYRLFGLENAIEDPCKGILVIVEDSGKQVAILVDELLGQQQTVIKNLGEGVGTVQGVAGASIMANGQPGLILDISGMIKMAVS